MPQPSRSRINSGIDAKFAGQKILSGEFRESRGWFRYRPALHLTTDFEYKIQWEAFGG